MKVHNYANFQRARRQQIGKGKRKCQDHSRDLLCRCLSPYEKTTFPEIVFCDNLPF